MWLVVSRSGGCGGAISGMGVTMPRSVELSCVPEGMQPAMVHELLAEKHLPFWSLGAKVLRELNTSAGLVGLQHLLKTAGVGAGLPFRC